MLIYVAVIVILLIIWLFLKWVRVRSYWVDRGVPHDPPHPVLGSLTFLQKQNPGIWIREIYKRFKSPYVGIWLFWRPALIINDPVIAQRILVKDFDVFRNRLLGSGSSKVDPLGGLNIFTANEPLWSSMRRPMSSMFTSSKLKSLHNLLYEKSKELVQRIDNSLKNDQQLELRTTFSDYSTDIISIAAFGVDSNATLTGNSPIRSVTKDFMKFSIIRGFAWCSIFFFPELVEIFRFKMFPQSAQDYFRRVFKQVVAQRGGYNGEYPINDFIDILRRMKYESDKIGEAMDEDLLIAQAVIMLQGGYDTTSSTLKFPYLRISFQSSSTETLRKYSAMGWLDRICDRDYRIDDSLVIPKGTTVYVNSMGMHWDPEIYPEPEKFYPERFLHDEAKGKLPFMPFGEGPRSCIGRRFTYHTLWYGLYHIILNYELHPLAGAKKPEDIEADKRGLFLTPGEDFFLKFVPRL